MVSIQFIFFRLALGTKYDLPSAGNFCSRLGMVWKNAEIRKRVSHIEMEPNFPKKIILTCLKKKTILTKFVFFANFAFFKQSYGQPRKNLANLPQLHLLGAEMFKLAPWIVCFLLNFIARYYNFSRKTNYNWEKIRGIIREFREFASISASIFLNQIPMESSNRVSSDKS